MSLLAPPTSLKSVGNSLARQITLSWTKPPLVISGFLLQISRDRGATWTDLVTLPANRTTHVASGMTPGQTLVRQTDPNVAKATDTGLKEQFEYWYRVVARNLAGTSGNSNEVSAKTPLGLPAAPTGVKICRETETTLEVEWTDASQNETSFTVFYRTGGTIYTQGPTVGTDVTAASLTGLSPGTTYTITVVAYNTAGNSPDSATVTGTTKAAAKPPEPPPPTPPAAPTAFGHTNLGNAKVTLKWHNDPVTPLSGF